MSKQQVWIIIPFFGRADGLVHVLEHLGRWASQNGELFHLETVVVDDGNLESFFYPSHAPSSLKLHLLRHPVNLGQGAALQTGIEFALSKGAEVFVTLDADGQHPIVEIPALLKPLLDNQADIAFGNRFGGKKAVRIPFTRSLILRVASIFERWTTGLQLHDAHNGFRAFNRKTAQLLQIEQNRMAHATEIKKKVAQHRLRVVEVEVTITYTDESLAQGQRSSGAALILKDLIKQYLFEG